MIAEKTRRRGFREYKRIKNYANYRCTIVTSDFEKYWGTNDCPEEFWEENVQEDLASWVSGKYTWNNERFYFEDPEDAVVFKLKYPCR